MSFVGVDGKFEATLGLVAVHPVILLYLARDGYAGRRLSMVTQG